LLGFEIIAVTCVAPVSLVMSDNFFEHPS